VFVGEVNARVCVVQSGTDIHGIIGDVVEVGEVVHDYVLSGGMKVASGGIKPSGGWSSLPYPLRLIYRFP
jgi:hypothetical protein